MQLSDLCTVDDRDRPALVSAVNVTMPHKYVHRPTAKTEFVASSAAHLELLLSCMDVDIMFAVQPLAQPQDPLEPEDAPQSLCSQPTQTHVYANGDAPHSNGNMPASEGGNGDTEEADPEREAWKSAFAAKKEAFIRASMLWAFQAHQRVKHRSKLSLLTFGAHRPVTDAHSGQGTSAAIAASVALARTLHMENKGACGPAIDIWPTEAPMEAKVRLW